MKYKLKCCKLLPVPRTLISVDNFVYSWTPVQDVIFEISQIFEISTQRNT